MNKHIRVLNILDDNLNEMNNIINSLYTTSNPRIKK